MTTTTSTTGICRVKTPHLLLYMTLVSIASGYAALNLHALLRNPSAFAQQSRQMRGIYEQLIGKRGKGV